MWGAVPLCACQLAKDEGLTEEVPSLRKWETIRMQPHRWVSQDKFPDLLRELAPHQRPMVLFAVHTGLRQANVLGLTWDCVDLERRIVVIHAIDTKANKTRTAPLNDTALSVLAAVQRYMPPDGPDAKDTLSEIAIVDPWPLGPLEKS